MAAALDIGTPVLGEHHLGDRIARDKPVAVLFYADWCPFCKAFVPTWANKAPGLPIEAVAANLSHPEDPRWEAYGVETIPTIVVYRAGQEVGRVAAKAGVGLEEAALDAVAELAPGA